MVFPLKSIPRRSFPTIAVEVWFRKAKISGVFNDSSPGLFYFIRAPNPSMMGSGSV